MIVDSFDGEKYTGRSYLDAPEIDSGIIFTSDKPLSVGEFTDVRYVLYLGINDKEFKQSSVMIQANPTKTEFYGG